MAYVVRYGRMRFLGEYAAADGHIYPRGQRVVVRSDRGTELGEVLCTASPRTEAMLDGASRGEILRPLGDEDAVHASGMEKEQENAFSACRELVSKRRLQMELVDVELLFGRERVIFYYLAEKRVDFRELVKDLARVLHTRIEMRQIGVRDEAKLLADYGDCGKPVCCNTHLTAMPPVSMKMAKLQKTTLDPAKISGRCGRLKCCLRYEFDTYVDFERELPSVGSMVVTPKGRGKVVAQEILSLKVLVEYEDRRRVIVGRDEILSIQSSGRRGDRGGGPASGRGGRKSERGRDDRDGHPLDEPGEDDFTDRDGFSNHRGG